MGQGVSECQEESVECAEDLLRDYLERAELLAQENGFEVLQHLLAMSLLELNEMDGHSRLQALIIREQSRGH
jgi:hypothetical protein